MPRYRVRPGQQLPHAGTVFDEGAVVELPRLQAVEFPHLVQEIDAEGTPLDAPPDHWAMSLETVRQHERLSVLQIERRALEQRLADLREAADHADSIAARAHRTVAATVEELARVEAAIERERAAPDPGAPGVPALPSGVVPSRDLSGIVTTIQATSSSATPAAPAEKE